MELNYECSAIDHWIRCDHILSNANSIHFHFYAALELRFCLERLCFEYLILSKAKSGGSSKSDRKQYSPKEIMKRAFSTQDRFNRHCEFMSAIYRLNGIPNAKMLPPNVDWLEESHGKLGDFLHAIRDKPDPIRLKTLIDTVKEIHHDIQKFLPYRGDIDKMPPQVQSVYHKFLDGELDQIKMVKLLEISNIPRHLQNPYSSEFEE